MAEGNGAEEGGEGVEGEDSGAAEGVVGHKMPASNTMKVQEEVIEDRVKVVDGVGVFSSPAAPDVPLYIFVLICFRRNKRECFWDDLLA